MMNEVMAFLFAGMAAGMLIAIFYATMKW